MKFKMAATAILNLLFLSILVIWSFQVEAVYPTAILNYNFVMLDQLRSPFVHLKFPFKFRVD